MRASSLTYAVGVEYAGRRSDGVAQRRWRRLRAEEEAEDAAENFKGKAAVGLKPVVLYCWARARGGGGGVGC